MRITVVIEDSLHKRAREVAAELGMTLRALVEQGLEEIVNENPPTASKAKGVPLKRQRPTQRRQGKG